MEFSSIYMQSSLDCISLLDAGRKNRLACAIVWMSVCGPQAAGEGPQLARALALLKMARDMLDAERRRQTASQDIKIVGTVNGKKRRLSYKQITMIGGSSFKLHI
jgi:hypothetical protein